MQAVIELIQTSRIRDLGPLPAPRLATNATVQHGMQMLVRARRGAVVVLDGASPAGIFTERDLTYRMADGFATQGKQRHTPIREVMTRPPITVARDDTLGTALTMMNERDVNHLVVVDAAGDLRGLLTGADVLQFLLDQFPEETVNLPPRLRQQFHRPEGA